MSLQGAAFTQPITVSFLVFLNTDNKLFRETTERGKESECVSERESEWEVLTRDVVLGQPDHVSEDLVQAGVEALHAAVDVTLLLLD